MKGDWTAHEQIELAARPSASRDCVAASRAQKYAASYSGCPVEFPALHSCEIHVAGLVALFSGKLVPLDRFLYICVDAATILVQDTKAVFSPVRSLV